MIKIYKLINNNIKIKLKEDDILNKILIKL